MKHRDLLMANLSLLFRMRFTDRGVNINYHESNGVSCMDYRDVSYEFTFVEKRGGTRFVMKVTPDKKGLIKKILEKLREGGRMSHKSIDDSRYFTDPRISEENNALVVDCRLKRKIKGEEEEPVFRDQLWGVVMKPTLEQVYDY